VTELEEILKQQEAALTGIVNNLIANPVTIVAVVTDQVSPNGLLGQIRSVIDETTMAITEATTQK
jgi:spore coat protein CotF